MDEHERRLAAIVVADVVGYSRMVAEDEGGTLSVLRAHRNALDPVVLNHGGRIVKGTGDGVLVEFPSAVAAVEASVEIQDLMRVRNEELPESRRMEFRLGIDVADVVVDETGDVFGDGVNIAARVESLADPGGVAVTNAVFEAVRAKTAVEFVDDGDHELKNIPTPVRVWKVGSSSTPRSSPKAPRQRRVATVAVMPFENMSGDEEQEYFADGITEDLITALSHDRTLGVVARNSTFAYKGSPADVRTVARELDATHVVEGSVRRAADRLRITAQLIDAESGHHIWAERYDRSLADVFELQDEVVEAITSRLRPTLLETEGRRRTAADSNMLDAWDLTLQGLYQSNKHTTESFLAAVELFEQAQRLEPDFLPAIAAASINWIWLGLSWWETEEIDPWQRAGEAAEVAHRLDPDDYGALVALSVTESLRGDVEKGIHLAERLIELNPHEGAGFQVLGGGLLVSGRAEEAIPVQTQAWRLGRHEPWRFDIASDLAHSHYFIRNYEAAAKWGEQALQIVNDYIQADLVLAATYGQLDRPMMAHEHVEAILRRRPDFTCSGQRDRMFFTRPQDRDHIIEGLLKSGLPE